MESNLSDIFYLSLNFSIYYIVGFFWAYKQKGLLRLKLEAVSGRVVKDVHTALKETFLKAAIIFMILLFIGYLLHMNIDSKVLSYSILNAPALVIGYLTIHFINVWRSYSFGIMIDASKDIVDIPASDVENSFMDLLTLKQFLDHAQRETLKISAIERIDNYTDRKHGNRHYFVTLSGTFGSRSLAFASKQKRDETRNALFAEYRKLTGKTIHGDFNVDF